MLISQTKHQTVNFVFRKHPVGDQSAHKAQREMKPITRI